MYSLIVAAFLWLTPRLAAQGINMSQNLVMFKVNGGIGLPAADLAKRFGYYGKVGAGVSYRFGDNWYATLSGDFIFGSGVKEDDALDHILTESGRLIGIDGILYLPELQMRGWQWMVWGGKLFPLKDQNTSTGILVKAGAGLVQHRINYFLTESGTVPQITGAYEKGYDRLSSGFSIAEYVGYHYLSTNRLINFNIGLEMVQAFAANRRGFDYARGAPMPESRLDLMFNIKATWILPFYRRDKVAVPDESDF